MKKLLLVPALAALLLTSCNNDPELEAPQISSIDLSKEQVAVGQLIILSSTVTDTDTDTADLTYDWKSTDGFSSDERVAEWVPSETGEQTITLTVNDGNATTTQETTVDVVEPDFRLGLWGDTQEDIIRSEEYADNELLDDEDGLLVFRSEEPQALDVYVIEADALVQAATIYYPEHSESELNEFITDYEAKVAELTNTYGEPVEEYTDWEEGAEATYANNPEQWGQAIAAGDLSLGTVWLVSETTGVVLALQTNGDGGIFYALIYFPLEDGRYASELRKGNASEYFEKYPDKFKNIRSLQK